MDPSTINASIKATILDTIDDLEILSSVLEELADCQVVWNVDATLCLMQIGRRIDALLSQSLDGRPIEEARKAVAQARQLCNVFFPSTDPNDV